MELSKYTQQQWFGRIIGPLAYDGPSTGSLACLTFLNRLQGGSFSFGEVFCLAPVGADYSEKSTFAAARRLGFSLSYVEFGKTSPFPLLGILHSGYSFLVFGVHDESAMVMLPGVNHDINSVRFDSDLIADAIFFTLANRPIRLSPRFTPALKCSSLGIAINGWSSDQIAVKHLKDWNAELGANDSNYGNFRSRGLRRLNCDYFHPSKVETEIQGLLDFAHAPIDSGDALRKRFLIYLFLDFCAIHPFMNGNGRVAVRLCRIVAEKLRYGFDLRAVPRSELYYWVGAMHKRNRLSQRMIDLISKRIYLAEKM